MLVNGLDFSRQIQKKKEKYDYVRLSVGEALKAPPKQEKEEP